MESVSLERITVVVYGLTKDGGATLNLEQALLGVPGVSLAYVNAATEMAYVEYAPTQITHAQLLRAIEGVGLKAGELNVRSVGSKLPLLAQRRAATADVERIEQDESTGGVPAGATHSHTCHLQRSTSTWSGQLHVAEYPLGHLSGYSWQNRWHRWLQMKFPTLSPRRLSIFAIAAGLVAVLGALLWLALRGEAMPEKSFSVEVGAAGFIPVAVVIPAGKSATLRVRNADLASAPGGASHQFAIGELGINVKLEPGQSTVIDLRPLQPAVYHFYCDVCCGGSNDPAMQGALIVH